MKQYKLDERDRKILYELDKNSRSSYVEIAKKTGTRSEVVFHRINKLVEQEIITVFQTVVAISRIGYTACKLYVKFQNTTKNDLGTIYRYLMENDAVSWFGVCQGKWDLIIAEWAKDSFEFSKLVLDFQTRFHEFIIERGVTFGINTMQYGRKWLVDDKLEDVSETEFGTGLEHVELSNNEREVLRYLANNARITIQHLSQLTKLAPNTVKGNIARLEEQHIISGYKIIIDTHKIGYEACKAFIYFKLYSEKRAKEFQEYCKKQRHIINIVFCVGTWDAEIEFEVEHFDQYYQEMELIKEQFSDLIRHYESVVFTREPKKSFMPGCYPQLKD